MYWIILEVPISKSSGRSCANASASRAFHLVYIHSAGDKTCPCCACLLHPAATGPGTLPERRPESSRAASHTSPGTELQWALTHLYLYWRSSLQSNKCHRLQGWGEWPWPRQHLCDFYRDLRKNRNVSTEGIWPLTYPELKPHCLKPAGICFYTEPAI